MNAARRTGSAVQVRALGTLILAVMAFAGNLLSLPLFFGVDFIFGSIAVMLAVLLLGTLPAVVVAFAGGIYTLTLWGHPYALIIFALEALVVSLLFRKGVRNLLLADLAYWLLIGVPLVFLFYRGAMGMGWEASLTIALKQPINGMFNALLAALAVTLAQLRLPGLSGWLPEQPRLQNLLFYTILTLTLLAGTAPIIYESHNQRSTLEAFMAERLQTEAQQVMTHQSDIIDDNVVYAEDMLAAMKSHRATMAVLDGNNQVLVSSDTLPLLPGTDGHWKELKNGLRIWVPPGEMSTMQRWQQGRYQYEMPLPAEMPLPGKPPGARVIIEAPAEPLVKQLKNQNIRLFLMLTVILLLAILASAGMSRWIARPLGLLDRASGYLTAQIAAGMRPQLPESRVQEYGSLASTLQTMSEVLADSFHELHQAQSGLELQVSERTQALAQTNSRLQGVLMAATEIAIIATDRRGLITLFNIGAEKMLGYTANEIVGCTNAGFFLLPEELEIRSKELESQFGEPVEGLRVITEVVDRSGKETSEWTFVHRDGSHIPVALTVTQQRDDVGKITGYLGIAEDITERKRIDRMKNEFVSTVSHELRTPLTAITGSLGLITSGKAGELPAMAGKMLDIAHRNGQRLTFLINDLLDLEKIAAGKIDMEIQTEALIPVITESLENHRALGAEHKVAMVLDPPDTQPLVRADRQRLQQVLANLLSNAIKFSPEGGTVRVSVNVLSERVRVTVTDDGPGIPAGFHGQIFKKFSQADSSDTRRQGGTGLGLAISRELMELMDGQIGFDSEEGKGASFWFELSISAGDD